MKNLNTYSVTCPATKMIDACSWSGDIAECRRISDNTFSGWITYWICPKCGSTVAHVDNNSPLNHPLQEHSKVIEWKKLTN